MKKTLLPVVCLTLLSWVGGVQAETVKLQIKGAY